MAIGDAVLDLRRAAMAGLLGGTSAELVRREARLNAIFARPSRELTGLRHDLAALLDRGSD